jgi:ABC-type proline/glycine betaine transport system substrate-binding protein
MNLTQLRTEKIKTETRIQVLQEKLNALNEKEIELENSEILKTVRALQLRPSELDALMKRLKQNPFEELTHVNAWIPESELEENEN